MTPAATLLAGALLAGPAAPFDVDRIPERAATALTDYTAGQWPASPDPAVPPLTLPEVQATLRAHPEQVRIQHERAMAEAKALAARGGLDLGVTARSWAASSETYERQAASVRLEQPTTLYGLTPWAEYGVGVGKFPVYEEIWYTGAGGELSAGVSLPLLEGGRTDPVRAGIRVAELAVDQLEAEIALDLLSLQAACAVSYWGWVEAGHARAVALRLRAIAQDRDGQLAERVGSGELPPVDRLDNRRTLLQRQEAALTAERDLVRAALRLSLCLREGDGPVVPDPQRLPRHLTRPPLLDPAALEADRARALRERPELGALRAAQAAAEVEAELARNQRLPSLDLSVSGSRELGGQTADETEVKAALYLSSKVQRRKAIGTEQAWQEKAKALEVKARYAEEKVSAEITDAFTALQVAVQRVALAEQELAAAQMLEEAELRRLDLGDTSLFMVNQREQATAESALRLIRALTDSHRAWIEYQRVTLRLGSADATS